MHVSYFSAAETEYFHEQSVNKISSSKFYKSFWCICK